MNDPALQDADFRRAIFRALDPWSLNGQIWHGLAEVTGGMPAPSPDWRLTEAELREHLADPAAAREMLKLRWAEICRCWSCWSPTSATPT